MIRIVTTALLGCALGGCSITMTKPLRCVDTRVQGWIGQKFTPRVEARLKRKAYVRTARVVRPGDVTTMEFNDKRLTISVDERDTITALRCG